MKVGARRRSVKVVTGSMKKGATSQGFHAIIPLRSSLILGKEGEKEREK